MPSSAGMVAVWGGDGSEIINVGITSSVPTVGLTCGDELVASPPFSATCGVGILVVPGNVSVGGANGTIVVAPSLEIVGIIPSGSLLVGKGRVIGLSMGCCVGATVADWSVAMTAVGSSVGIDPPLLAPVGNVTLLGGGSMFELPVGFFVGDTVV